MIIDPNLNRQVQKRTSPTLSSGWPAIAIVCAWMAVVTMGGWWIGFLIRELTFFATNRR